MCVSFAIPVHVFSFAQKRAHRVDSRKAKHAESGRIAILFTSIPCWNRLPPVWTFCLAGIRRSTILARRTTVNRGRACCDQLAKEIGAWIHLGPYKGEGFLHLVSAIGQRLR